MYWISLFILPVFLLNKLFTLHNTINKVSTLTSKSYLGTIKGGCLTLLTTYYIKFLQLFTNNIMKLGKNTYALTFCLEGKLCSVVVNVKRGPSSEIRVLTNNGEDVTSFVKPFIRSHFKVVHATPMLLGFEKISITEEEVCVLYDKNSEL